MKVKRRHIKIVDFVRRNKRATVEELAELLDISRETIRRDLGDLAQAGKIRKIHGGATLPRIFGEGSFQQRLSQNVDAKIRIAETAVRLFSPGDTLLVDTGSTTLYLAEKLADLEGITVVTNSVAIANTLAVSTNGTRAFLLGGEYSPDNRHTLGTMAAAQVRLFRAHHAVLTVGGLDCQSGAMDFDVEEAQLARAMIEQSQSLTVLMDSSKFDQVASFEVCQLSQIDRLITDNAPPKALKKVLKMAGVTVMIAE